MSREQPVTVPPPNTELDDRSPGIAIIEMSQMLSVIAIAQAHT